jgi:peptidyl-prolyl cis-trans isomerase D
MVFPMMQAFRRSAKVVAVVFALLMLVFVVTSVDWTSLSSNQTVGKVNGQSIDARTYQTIVQQSINARQQQSAENLSLEDYEQVRDQVWDQIVQSRVLETEYRRRGITVTDDEVVQAIRNSPLAEFQNVPEFQTDSQFDLAKYQPSSISPVWKRNIGRSCNGPSFCGSSLQTSTCRTQPCGSDTGTKTKR